LGASLLGVFAPRRRGRLAILPSAFGIALVLTLLVATYAAGRAAFQLPFYGNSI